MAPVNVFALVGAGHPKFQANKEDNEALKKANPDYAKRFMVARNMPANDTNWNSSATEHVGKASMSKRHRSDGCASNQRCGGRCSNLDHYRQVHDHQAATRGQ